MSRLFLVVTAVAMISIISWFIDVFGRTLTLGHPRHVQGIEAARTWDGRVIVHRRSDPMS